MSLRKVLSLIVAVAMISTLAISAGATWTINFEGGLSFQDNGEVTVTGGDLPEKDTIHYDLIKAVRFTFDIPNYECGVETACTKKSVAVSWNSKDTGFKQQDFCYDEQKSLKVDLSGINWDPDEAWLKFAVASWNEGFDGTVKIEVLGAGDVVLARGAGYGDEAPTTPTVTNPPVQQSGGEDGKQATGMGGVAVLGAVAILAAGAVVVSRKRK
jgi:hypothetical protein